MKLFEFRKEVEAIPADSNDARKMRRDFILMIIGCLHRFSEDLGKAKDFVSNSVLDAYNDREYRNHLPKFYRENVSCTRETWQYSLHSRQQSQLLRFQQFAHTPNDFKETSYHQLSLPVVNTH